MDIKINDYYEPDHFRAICEDNYNVSRTCEYEKNEMHHIHNSNEVLLVEDGAADYYISGKKYHVEPGDILVIGAMEHHLRRIDRLPFSRYGFTVKPDYVRGIIPDRDLQRAFSTPSPEKFVIHYKHVDPEVFSQVIYLLCCLKEEENLHKPFRSLIQRTVITQIAVILFRVFQIQRGEAGDTPTNIRMQEVKEYVDSHFDEELNLQVLGELFFLHPSTISREFNRYFGYNLNKYINRVRVCEAAGLLESNSDSIAVIAQKCGYDSVNTFLRQFRSIMDISPLQYRKSIHDCWKNKQGNEGK